jgi:hypothetical protein
MANSVFAISTTTGRPMALAMADSEAEAEAEAAPAVASNQTASGR